MSDTPKLLSTSAMALSSSALLLALIGVLKAKGIFSDADETNVYETALLLLEESEANDDTGAVELAREVIEAHLES
ncbi:hypothetical protein [Rhizobium sp. BK376]|uniref:hypothetical protein n=1 Tax=Rhizobium sp. BK376 TaxID=2512149 RepID=UPI00104E8F44|nr:hypothetical protein [Rhizobium sp. BK376]TCR72636.1 hypothetical protein EV561_1285 [Rhizobium sp. BK376]